MSVIDADDMKRARENDPVITVEGNRITLVFPDVVTVEPGVALAELIKRWMNAEQMPMTATYDRDASVLTVRPHHATCPANWYDPCTCEPEKPREAKPDDDGEPHLSWNK